MKVSITYPKKSKEKVTVLVTFDDLWNGDTTLARVIYPFLKKYRALYDKRKGLMVYPAEFAPDPTEPEGPNNPDRFDDWLKCLDKMIYAFGWIAKSRGWDGPEEKNFEKECHRLLKPHKKELTILRKKDRERRTENIGTGGRELLEFNRRSEILQPALEIYIKKFEDHRKQLQEGIDLFAQYFGSFWV